MKLPLQMEPILRHGSSTSNNQFTEGISPQDCPGGFMCNCSTRSKCCKKNQTCNCKDGIAVCS